MQKSSLSFSVFNCIGGSFTVTKDWSSAAICERDTITRPQWSRKLFRFLIVRDGDRVQITEHVSSMTWVSHDHEGCDHITRIQLFSDSFVGGFVCDSTCYSGGGNVALKDQPIGLIPTHMLGHNNT